jgi:DNA helicase-2/ATP-dependent DNA helicase PcrA
MAAPQSSSLDLDFPSPLDYMSKRSANALTEFASAMRDLRRLAQRDSVEAVLHAVVERMEILQLLDRTSKSTSEFEERKQNVEELQKATRRYTDLGPCLVANEGADDEEGDSKELDAMDCPLRSFLDDVALVTDLAERSADERFVVNLMTIHASKGKEFDTVYVVGNEDGTLPSSQAIQEGEGSDELEEERRLCYVAMTRAKTELYLTWRQVVSVFTGQGIRQESRRRSRFLNILAGDRGKGNEKKEVYENPRPWLGSTGKSNERRYSRNAGAGAGRYSTPRQYGPPQAFKPYVVPSNPFSGELEGTTSVYGSGRRQPKQQRTPRQRRDAEEAVALYFPAGTIVIHRARGRGVVIPRPSRDADPELVYVKFFESGTLGQFSPYSDDLFPHSRSRRDRD